MDREPFDVAAASELLVRYDEEKRAYAKAGRTPPIQVAGLIPQRNSPCPCGSGRKYKVCCRKVQPYVV